jgi:hypothetical protein
MTYNYFDSNAGTSFVMCAAPSSTFDLDMFFWNVGSTMIPRSIRIASAYNTNGGD